MTTPIVPHPAACDVCGSGSLKHYETHSDPEYGEASCCTNCGSWWFPKFDWVDSLDVD